MLTRAEHVYLFAGYKRILESEFTIITSGELGQSFDVTANFVTIQFAWGILSGERESHIHQCVK